MATPHTRSPLCGVQRIMLDEAAIVLAYLAGKPADEIADAHHVSRDTVLRRLDEAGVRKRRRADYRWRATPRL